MSLFQPPSGISFPIFSLSFIIIMQEMELFKSSSRGMLGIWGWWKSSYREAGINVMLAFSEFERDTSIERTLGGKALARRDPDFWKESP